MDKIDQSYVQKVTSYLFDVLDTSNYNISIKDKNQLIQIKSEELGRGILSDDTLAKFKEKYGVNETSDILVFVRTINEEVVTKPLLIIPATLNGEGKFSLPSKGNPWINIDYLEPYVDDINSIGKEKDMYDFFNNFNYLKKITDEKQWALYMVYSELMFQHVCGDKQINKENKGAEDLTVKIINDRSKQIIKKIKDKVGLDINTDIYIVKYSTNNIESIKKVYTNINNTLNKESGDLLKLYKKVVNESEQKHQQKIGSDYYYEGLIEPYVVLDDSQRAALNSVLGRNEDVVSVVEGPPGTGKTTLIQSIVSSYMVKYAIEERRAPIILAVSSTNEAVKNILDKFDGNNRKIYGEFDGKWLDGPKELGVYFPALSQKENETYLTATQLGYVKDNYNMRDDSETNEVEKLYQELRNKVDNLFGDYNIQDCVSERIRSILVTLNDGIKGIVNTLENNDPNDIIEKIDQSKNRHKEWVQYRNSRSFVEKNLCYFKYYSKKYILKFAREDEKEFAESFNRVEDIIAKYYKESQAHQKKIKHYNEIKEKICRLLEKIDCNLSSYEHEKFIARLKYILHWLSVHYFEARQLEMDFYETTKQNDKIWENVIENRFKYMSYYTPCFAMTLHQVPKILKAEVKVKGETVDKFLFDYADLLLFDEAGQTNTELGLMAMAFAKKVIVIGDSKQLQPISSISLKNDCTLMMKNNLISNEVDYYNKNIRCSKYSLMKVCKQAVTISYGNETNGIQLKEHRRCYAEIINFCNKNYYNNTLKPKRFDTNNSNILPKMSYVQVKGKSCTEIGGTSRANEEEVKRIVKWLTDNYDSINNHYIRNKNRSVQIGIITPFKLQAYKMKTKIQNDFKVDDSSCIRVGSVYSFQGKEVDIVLFSTVYADDDNCWLINKDIHTLNVAVSRARDAFVLFGDIDCLRKLDEQHSSHKQKTESSKLIEYIDMIRK